MKMIAAMQARSETVRGAPPRAWEGGGGNRGWIRCHSWSGSNRSARVVMSRDHGTQAARSHLDRVFGVSSEDPRLPSSTGGFTETNQFNQTARP
jgi:hypothetical protein